MLRDTLEFERCSSLWPDPVPDVCGVVVLMQDPLSELIEAETET